jgi:integrase
MARSNLLTAVKVAKLTEPGRYLDGDGLYLQISQWRTKAWLFRFERDGRERQMGLGPVSTLTLAQARERANTARRLLLDGLDPIESRNADRDARRLEAAKRVIFSECAEAFLKSRSKAWRNLKHAAQWRATLRTYAYPIIGTLPVKTIDTQLVLKILEPIWETKTETANRLRGRLEQIFDYAAVKNMRAGDNPARWKGQLQYTLAKRSDVAPVKHHKALDYHDIPAFMAELRARDGMSARALEFLILTATRTSAVIGATHDEVNGDVWEVAPERTGSKITEANPKPRRVPLCARAVEILDSLPRADGNPYLFIGAKSGMALSNMVMLELMREMRPGFVPHGFRSTFKDWSAETTHYAKEASEAALWHVNGDKVERAYRRGDLFEKRRALMNDWAVYCAGEQIGKVFNLRRGGAV